MERYLQPERFDCSPNSSLSSKQWTHWYKTFSNFLTAISKHEPDKLATLVNSAAPSVYEFISECKDYESAIETLRKLYIKPKNEVFARHLLATRSQRPGETLDEFIQALKQLSTDCNFKAVSADQYKEESIRDAFIAGLQSQYIRQRLLENKTLELQAAIDQAMALDLAQKNSETYVSPHSVASTTSMSNETTNTPVERGPISAAVT